MEHWSQLPTMQAVFEWTALVENGTASPGLPFSCLLVVVLPMPPPPPSAVLTSSLCSACSASGLFGTETATVARKAVGFHLLTLTGKAKMDELVGQPWWPPSLARLVLI